MRPRSSLPVPWNSIPSYLRRTPNSVAFTRMRAKLIQPSNSQQFEKFLELQPNVNHMHTLVADLYRQRKNLDLAQKHYRQALAIDPNFVFAINNLAWMYATEGKNLDVALGLAEKAKQLQPDSPAATDTLAWIEYKKGLYADAISMLEECVAKQPGSPVFHYHLGMALLASGEKKKSKTHLETSLRLKLNGEEAQAARRGLEQMN
jgi:tetratricopeptide (TPR) repeat protein